MNLVGVDIKNDPFWEFTFSCENGYSTITVHKNSEFASAFRAKDYSTVNFGKKVKLVVDDGTNE